MLVAEVDWVAWAQTTGWILVAIALLLMLVVSWLTNLVGLPGNWLAVLMILVYVILGPTDSRLSVGWIVFAVCGLLAVAGEVVEFLSAAAGAKNAGASLKSTVYSVVGSIAGAFLGAFVGIPIPVIGPVIAALLFGGLGAAGGAMLGEWTDGRQWKENVSIGKSTFLSKTYGTLGKFALGGVILPVFLVALLV
ncbi:hypothetical protein SV7mr_20140 [Stieleria bergensis]|uniref:DUF456 domain-containing protein n=1 Tax=Stieleria bergensis TaxID=2528025 RepID=A0A517STQ9_9BACT|nr:hypothetical protein SV7mr_20140 [Planctomycetes bacterium SV_7m_r]